ncbi:MAG: acetyl-CoA carboxylase carboxyltransferase subunit beta [Bdellovibrionales bacterium]|nr:acetyl-CoA carboxylase carboxyltransferase subunit beta [Bdellovibrionales bacterium]
MASWFSRSKAPKPTTELGERLEIPGGLWTKCPGCGEIIYSRELERSRMVCPKCDYHFRLSAEQRLELLCDRQSFEEFDVGLKTNDPLSFKDSMRYRERLKRAEKKTAQMDAVRVGRARIDGHRAMLGVFNFAFMGGSMGLVVGEKLTRMVEAAIQERLPVIIVSASGGARMQEGIYSLMQMAKVTAALVRLGERGLPYISVLTDPTTGGVAASFAMQGDVIVAEPGALIGFAGPRVIEQTIRSKLPEGFQRSEFLLEHGMVDLISPRAELKKTLATLLEVLAQQ